LLAITAAFYHIDAMMMIVTVAEITTVFWLLIKGILEPKLQKNRHEISQLRGALFYNSANLNSDNSMKKTNL
jgi:hypothetical protein